MVEAECLPSPVVEPEAEGELASEIGPERLAEQRAATLGYLLLYIVLSLVALLCFAMVRQLPRRSTPRPQRVARAQSEEKE